VRCPACASNSRVLDTNTLKDAVIRRRTCLSCSTVFGTVEERSEDILGGKAHCKVLGVSPKGGGGPVNHVIYFLENPYNRTIKIGFSTRVWNRIRALSSSSGVQFVILGWITHATVELEKELHERFRDDRKIGEWFSGDIRGDIDALLGM